MTETNHLRKYANEAGKQMRGPKRPRMPREPHILMEKCQHCEYLLVSHDPRLPNYELFRREGMCGEVKSGKS